jgi:hypothetical protein
MFAGERKTLPSHLNALRAFAKDGTLPTTRTFRDGYNLPAVLSGYTIDGENILMIGVVTPICWNSPEGQPPDSIRTRIKSNDDQAQTVKAMFRELRKKDPSEWNQVASLKNVMYMNQSMVRDYLLPFIEDYLQD